ncbi:MAG: thioredoxin family protein [Alkalispirochaetaceae bacterium]
MSKKNGKNEPGSPQNRAKQREERTKKAHGKKRKKVIFSVAILLLVLLAAGGTITIFGRQVEKANDLSQVGKGVPAVVQVHDNTCPVCTELRATVERIEGDFSDETLLIRVADVHTEEGLEFAGRYTDARRATLLYIDGDGNLVNEISGAQGEAALRRTFRALAAGEM